MPEPAHSVQPLTTLDASPVCLATVESVVAGDRRVVTCGGEFDAGAEWLQPELHAALDRSATGVDLDLSEVEFCDCGGLNVLLGLRRAALDQGKTVAVQGCSPVVGRLLDLTGARELFMADDAENTAGGERPDGPGSPDDRDGRYGSDSLGGGSDGRIGPDTELVPALGARGRPVDVDEELRLEVSQLRRAMRTRPAIDAARGIVMASFGLSSEDAWTVLVITSQNTNVKVHHLAQKLMGAVHGAPVPDEVRQQMAAAVTRVREAPPTPPEEGAAVEGGAGLSDPPPATA